MNPQELQKRLQEQVAASPDSVKGALATAHGLRDFLQGIDKLEPDELELIVEQAIALLEGYYVHLPFKRAMHGIDPLRRLRLLQRRLPNVPSEIAFHKEMTEIFTSLRDLHTNYVLPQHFARMAAFLPFRVESWFEAGGKPHYIVSMLAQGFTHATFVPGVELRYYNGIPIERAIEIAAEYHAGSNPAARRARGIAGLTMRAMNISPPPDEEWAVIGYTNLNGVEEEVKLEWGITNFPAELESASPAALDASIASAMGLDLEGDTFRRLDRMLFSPDMISASQNLASFRASAKSTKRPSIALESAGGDHERTVRQQQVQQDISAYASAAATAVGGTDSTMPLVFTARAVPVGGRQVAHIRIHTFMVDDDDQFVNEFLRLITLPAMPQDGLIIDVRGNGGGLIWAGERLLQLLTPRTIEPCRAQLISTPQNLALSQSVAMLAKWRPSLERALATGAPYSSAFPITPPDRCNDIGQRYYGPVVLITDARCYSTTDIFAAGFRDHHVGLILGADQNMGAGGANVWSLDMIRSFLGQGAPLKALPKGAGMRVAIRRTLRVGDEAGTEMEDLGIVPDEEHPMTKDDLLKGNPDLLAHAVRMLDQQLASAASRVFTVTSAINGANASLTVACTRVDYFEVAVDGRSQGSSDVTNDAALITVTANAGSRVELKGFLGTGEHVCSRRLMV
jgi:C-terminal processing protease CtpA/Prc